MERTTYRAKAAARAPIRLVQRRELLPPDNLETQETRVAYGDTPSAAGASLDIDIGLPS
jgi:hypothetical protein